MKEGETYLPTSYYFLSCSSFILCFQNDYEYHNNILGDKIIKHHLLKKQSMSETKHLSVTIPFPNYVFVSILSQKKT